MSMDVNVCDLNEFNSEILHKYIEDVAKSQGINDFNYDVDYICDKGYTSSVFKVRISYCENEKKNNLSVIVKTLINTTKQELFYELHKREVLTYTDVLSKYKKIQGKCRMIDKFETSDCLLSSYEKGKEIIVIEDLNEKGFELSPDLKPYDYKEIDLAVRELAKFHALTFALEKYEAKAFIKARKEFKDLVYDEMFLSKSKLVNYFQDSYAIAVEKIHDDDARCILEQLEPSLLNILRKYVRAGGCKVLCHGDFWSNNIMFKYEEGIPTEARFIDYQTMRYANPLTDLYYLIYLTTDSKFRQEYLHDIQTIYYDSLNSYLSNFDIDIRSVYPREEYHDDLKEYKLFGLLVALIEYRLHISSDDETHLANEYNNNEVVDKPENVKLYIDKVNDIVNEFKDNGILNKIHSRL